MTRDDLGRVSFGRLDDLEVLGEGGSAIVYAARFEGQPVALKVLRPEVELEAKELQRFVEEAGRMRRVSHPSLVPLLDVGVLTDGRPYIAMPRFDGMPLSSRLTQGRLPLEQATTLFGQVVAATQALHDAGLVHRDIKPENVLWLAGGERLMLLDLGIAREADASPSTTTKAGMMRGTPAYMAPERFFGKPASISTDIYELALLFFIMVVGRLPWDPDDPRGRLTPRSPSELGVALPAPLTTVLMESLAVDFDRRPQSATELLNRVQAAYQQSWQGPHEAPLGMTPAASPAYIITPPQAGPSRPPEVFAQAPTEVYSPPRPFGAATLPSANPQPANTDRRGSAGLLVAGALIALLSLGAGVFLVSKFNQEPTRAPATANAREAEPSASTMSDGESSTDSSSSPNNTASAVAELAASTEPSGSAAPATTKPVPAAPAGSASNEPPPPAVVGDAPACRNLIALMCSKTSGATPAECSAWKGNVASWQAKYPPDVAAQTCKAAYDASVKGLALRREQGAPPAAPNPGGSP